MLPRIPSYNYDPLITIKQQDLVRQLGDGVFIGKWFVFVNATSMMAAQLSSQNVVDTGTFLLEPRIFFRGQGTLNLPGVEIQPTPLPVCQLLSLTSDKALYRLNRDTVHLLVAAPTQANAQKRLRLLLNGSIYADYLISLDNYGLCLWPMRDLPEGEYQATLVDELVDECRFEVAEYRLAPLEAQLLDQQLSGETLRYTLAVTAFDRPYTGMVAIELQEHGQRVSERITLRCGRDGQCRGAVTLAGTGPYTLNVIAGERTATVALKGSERQRRETLTISELGEARLLSLLPMPQSNECRGMYIARGGANTQPFLARRLVGQEIEITARVNVEFLRVVVVNPVRGTSGEKIYQHLSAEKSIHIPVPPPYGIILLAAFIDGNAWEGWCAVLRPSELHLQCEAPDHAKPGSSVSITLSTGVKERVVPVQLIVKDQRLIEASDPQVEFASAIKRNLSEWQQQSATSIIETTLAQFNPSTIRPRLLTASDTIYPTAFAPTVMRSPQPVFTSSPTMAPTGAAMPTMGAQFSANAAPTGGSTVVSASLAKVRLSFPEVVYNTIVLVHGQQRVEVTLGDSMTRYTIEAFALSPETLDWQRVETSLQATQEVYGELSVSPFVFPGDTVMGRLDVGASSGSAIVEVQHDGQALPLFDESGAPVEHGTPLPSASVVRFPVQPGAITAIVRDARKGGIDISERYVTAPGRLRHIVRHLRILTQGQGVTREDLHARELRVVPGLEQPFQIFVEGAVKYPHGCIEQSSTKFLAMYIGYISNLHKEEVASEYIAVLPMWYERIKSMYLPRSGFCLYPPAEGGKRQPDTHYAPLAVKHLLDLPTSEMAQRTGIKQPALLSMLDDLHTMARDAAKYYTIDYPPRFADNCQDAYRIIASDMTSQLQKTEALAFSSSRLTWHGAQAFVNVPSQSPFVLWNGVDVSRRAETAYAAAALLLMKDPSDIGLALAAVNYITGQTEASGRLYSTVDTAAGLALMSALRESAIANEKSAGRVVINEQEMAYGEVFAYQGEVRTIRCVEGIVAVQATSEIVEDWSTYKGELTAEVRLERQGRVQSQFHVGDALDLLIQVPRYEPGLIAHVCLPDALSRIVGGGQVKHFTIDFCEQNILRIPLAATGSTLGAEQHWAVLVRNMFKQEQVGNPGLMQVTVV